MKVKRTRVPGTPGPEHAGDGEQLGAIGTMQLPVLNVSLQNVKVEVQQKDDIKWLVIGPVAFVFGLPLDTDNAKKIGGQLASGIEIPSGSIVELLGRTRA